MNVNRLKELRKERGETQIELAQLLGLKTASAYNKKENGRVPISLKEAQILSEHFKQPIDTFCK
ncbi:MAG: helix-turn-helix domain-containing protein [Lachnospiraceae bacterium]|nr:helix-turn-helix domain-containing protein [Lachnospiraceae bacterium]